MDPISIKVTFDDLPLSIQNSIKTFFIVVCVFLITVTMCLYLYIVDCVYNKYIKKPNRMLLN